MKTLYLECSMGAAGDMLVGALLELIDNPDEFINEFNNIGLNDIVLTRQSSVKCGITGTHISVNIKGKQEHSEDYHGHDHNREHDHSHEHDHHHEHNHSHEHDHHSHNSLSDIQNIVNKLNISANVKRDVLAIYTLIAEAESHAHNMPVYDIHFHEVGTLDAIADITACCMLIEKLNPDNIISSPIHVGSGHVKCAHGVLPVPAPATAHILRNVPIYNSGIKGELCTPTGAALVKYFSNSFGDMPLIQLNATGYGMGTKDFIAANCLRAMFGTSEDINSDIVELSCNIDDMTAEEIAFAMDSLLDIGALDVFTQAIQMKKSRTATLFTVLCKSDKKDIIIRHIFKHTSTLGIREKLCKRYVLNRKINEIDTAFGKIRCKDSHGFGVNKSKYEYEDIASIAKANNLSISDVLKQIKHEQ